MKKSVAIFETSHFEGAYPVIRLFDDEQRAITVFTNSYCFRQFSFLFGAELNRYQWVLQDEQESPSAFINRTVREVNQKGIELLYLNTIDNNHLFYAIALRKLNRGVVTILTLHDINTHFHARFAFSLRRIARIIGKKQLIHLVGGFNVVSLTMIEYLKSKIPASKPVYCIPGAVYDEKSYWHPPDIESKIHIVVPGSIDEKRRNYQLVFDLLALANQTNLSVHITLLGGPAGAYGSEIIKKCKAYRLTKNNLSFYQEQVVDQPEFDRIMNEAHFIFIPSVIETVISDGAQEIYGITKSSGNVFDIIKHARPFIAPEKLKVDEFLRPSCLYYDKVADIINDISQWAAPPQYEMILQKAKAASENYTIQAIRKRNSALFD